MMITNTQEAQLPRWPFFFTYRDVVFSDEYAAEVSVRGRVLGVREGLKDVWMYGVNPGGLAAHGENEAAAHHAFRNEYRAVLFDVAAEAKTFDEFKTLVETFVLTANRETEANWLAAVAAVRAGLVRADGMRKEDAALPISVEITFRDGFSQVDNALEQAPAIAA